ncbi:MAG: PorV/PorQ family protein [Ignavibacterium sp.]|jgi:opacity protein-like surface antigen|nr:PorV/PorQ family protein [Ignavibacterium sp.]
MKKIILVIITLFITISLYAGDESRKGTTGADQLLVPVGARSIATGGAFVATVSGLESIYYNPAGLDLTKSTEAMFSYMNYIADINMSYFAAGTNLGDFGSIGLSFKTFDFGDIPVTTNELPDGTGATYSPTFLTIGLTYSKVLTDRVSIGTNVKLISENIQSTNASGFAIDAGVQYQFNDALSIGATINNIGGNMSYSGQDLRVQTGVPNTVPGAPNGTYEVVAEEFQIPSYFQLSLAYKFLINEQNQLDLATTFTANNSLDDAFNFGLEYGFMNNFFLRGGYNYYLGETNESIFGFTAGAGVNYDISDIGISFDYAYRDIKDFPTANHIFTVKLSFQ